ncbi:hypothetical protein K474DRAFT_1642587 [Panus rudis PR-1116 ss-1]|nr:hypothetical protein K474DRAFT_1642587 [Panus rudis PR-1116 ss-1]
MSRTEAEISMSARAARQLDYDPYTDYRHLPHSNSSHSSQQYASVPAEEEKALPSVSVTGQEIPLRYYPLSLFLIVFWVIFVAVVVTLLERSVAISTTIVRQPWYYSHDGLPNVLLTIFTQAHGPITAMHLSRLAISALRSSNVAPRTWLELFWLANNNWEGPVGMLITGFGMISRRVRISQSFTIFSLISLVALVTPLILNRAYPVQTLDVQVPQTITPSTISAERFGSLDAYAQVAAGGGMWATGLTVLDMFNSTSYTPAGVERGADTGDLFFAGDVKGYDVTLPGLRLRGSCHAVNGQSGLGNLTTLRQLCIQELPQDPEDLGLQAFQLYSSAIALNVSLCSTMSLFNPLVIPANTSALVWFDTANTTGVFQDTTVQGLVRCDSHVTTGRATIDGRNLTFDNFAEDTKFYKSTQGGEPLLIPLQAALYHLSVLGSVTKDSIGAQAVDIFKFVQVKSRYNAPSLDEMAAAMWRGTSHMTMAMALLGRDSGISYPAVAHVPVSARTRSNPFFIGAISLLGVWLVGLVYATARMFRRASSDSLDSYAAARLLVDKPHLVQGASFGTLDDNRQLLERFRGVGR